MYEEKILRLETEIQELKKYIKNHNKEIKKREKIVAMTINEEIESVLRHTEKGGVRSNAWGKNTIFRNWNRRIKEIH